MFIGNAQVVLRLRRAIGSGQVHAILLVGPRSIGKTTLALEIATGRLGHAYTTTDQDVQHLQPIDGKKIGIAAVHELLTKTRKGAISDRTIIISEADRLTPEASNALLVFLENPPSRTITILTSTSTAGVLPTIRSRCAPFVLGPVATAELRQGLADKGFTDAVVLEDALKLSQGLPGLALRFLQEPTTRVAIRSLAQLSTQWQTADKIARLKIAATISDDPARARQLLELLGSTGSIAQRPAVLLALRRLDRNVTPRAVLEAFAMLPT